MSSVSQSKSEIFDYPWRALKRTKTYQPVNEQQHHHGYLASKENG
jgi:hypothetical protein